MCVCVQMMGAISMMILKERGIAPITWETYSYIDFEYSTTIKNIMH